MKITGTHLPFDFACPVCRTSLLRTGPDRMSCPQDGRVFERIGGIWRFLPAERLEFYRPFIKDYEAIRKAEGRGFADPAYYRALPFHDLSGCFIRDWRIRAASFKSLVSRVVAPMEKSSRLRILDLGAGNGWLSNRLAQRGHQLLAVDLLENHDDGLGAHKHYGNIFTPVQAEYNRLPLADRQADLVIFNASFHYTIDAAATLGEALRVLVPGGRLAIVDTPVYNDPASGEQMITERRREFQSRFGFPSDRLHSENYLTLRRIRELAKELGLSWRVITPFYGLRWQLRPWTARLLKKREPARFAILVGQAEERPGR